MGQVYQEKFTIPFEMADVKGKLMLPQFLAKMLAVSGSQSAQLDRSDSTIFEQYGLVWIVTDYAFEINELPQFGQEVTIRTEAVAYNRLICYRTFDLLDAEGQVLMHVDSYFALMDPQKRKIVPVPETLIAPYQSNKVRKIARAHNYPELTRPQELSYHVRYFDIDMNGHVNNSRYLEWMYSAMGYDFLKAYQPARVWLKYSREVSPGGSILSQYEQDGLTSYHQIASADQVNAQAVIEWRKHDL